MARLRLVFALSLMSLGTWWGALAISGYYEPGVSMRIGPTAASVGLSAAPTESQFIALLSKERFVAAETPAPVTPAKAKPLAGTAKTKPPAAERRSQKTAAQLPWPLSLLANQR